MVKLKQLQCRTVERLADAALGSAGLLLTVGHILHASRFCKTMLLVLDKQGCEAMLLTHEAQLDDCWCGCSNLHGMSKTELFQYETDCIACPVVSWIILSTIETQLQAGDV